LRLRPIRPGDTKRERRFFERLSERTRFQRFMQHLTELTPQMLERFTRLDYARELARVALHRETEEFVAVGRYAPRPDGRTAEFALVVYEALYGHVLADNVEMLQLARRLGFEIVGRDLSDLTLERRLKSSAR
jgi:acetyltransferase